MAKTIKKLPDAEFEVMKAVWENEAPTTSIKIMEQLGNGKGWKAPQTAITLLLRLVDRGFLRTEKNGKEREYYPLVAREDYLKFETQNFMKTYHGNSFASFVSAFCDNAGISEKHMEEIIRIVEERGK